MRLIDTHTHLYEPEFRDDSEETIRRAVDAGVDRMLFPAVDSDSHAALFKICADHPRHCFAMMGLHPTSVNGNPRWKEELALVEKYLADPPVRFYGIGEVGLDLHWSQDYEKEQTEAMEVQIELAARYDLPLAIHTRDAWPQMLALLEAYRGRGLRGVMHAFSDTYESYRRVKECGDFLFGIGGVVTYKNRGWEELLPKMDLEDLVLETDSPYLTPVPYRGKRNESSYVTYVCGHVAQLKRLSAEEVAAVTTANAERMFAL